MSTQENITEDNFEEIGEALDELIADSTEDDQTESNVAIVVEVFTETAALVSSQQSIVVEESVSSHAHNKSKSPHSYLDQSL